jgi:hypothetical protein
MYKLSLRTESGQALALHGPDAAEPVRGARMGPNSTETGEALARDKIFLDLKGSGLRDFLYDLENLLGLARSGSDPVFVQIQAATGDAPLSSRVLDGSVELLGNGTSDRAKNFQGLYLHLLRENNWNETPHSLELQNGNGVDVVDGLTVYNHCDSTAGHQNYVDVLAGDLAGALPAPATLFLDLGEDPVRNLQTVIVAGGTDLKDGATAFDHVLEGESGAAKGDLTTNQVISSSSASHGSYRRIAWDATAETHLLYWSLASQQVTFAAGRAFRPVLRLHSLPGSANIYLRWKLAYPLGSTYLLQTGQFKLDPGHYLVAGPVISLPRLGAFSYDALTLELWGECASAAGRQLDIDFIHLLPVEQWAYLRPTGYCQEGYTLILDGPNNQVYKLDTSSQLQSNSHLLIGQPLYLTPGKHNRVYVLFEASDAMPINDTLSVQIACGARFLTP